MSKENQNKTELSEEENNKILAVLLKDLQQKNQELELSKEKLKQEHELNSSALNQADKANEREFEKFKIDHKMREKDQKQRHLIQILGIVFLLLIFSSAMIMLFCSEKRLNSLGEKIVLAILTFVGGFATGYGLKKTNQ